MNVASIIASLSAYGLLHMRGIGGVAGWRWMFLIEVSTHPISFIPIPVEEQS